MATQLDGVWPYQREQPDCVVLAPLPGVTPSPLPPVRIFLGTEEGQYRAERVFVWSILQVRDPARTIPRAIPIALTLTLVIYAVVAVTVLSALGPDRLASAAAPLADAVRAAGAARR